MKSVMFVFNCLTQLNHHVVGSWLQSEKWKLANICF